MNLQLSAASKTFLMGEYLTLSGKACLVLNTSPRFKLIVDDYDQEKLYIGFNLNGMSPGEKFLRENMDFFKRFKLRFYDPYEGLGGLGCSSAQFCLLARLKQYYENQGELSINKIIDQFQHFYENNSGYTPSSADLVSQLCGGITYFDKNKKKIEKLIWPFSDLLFCLIHTHHKTNTFEHLKNLSQIDVDDLEPIVTQGLNSLINHNQDNFIDAINSYSAKMQKKNLVAQSTITLLKLLHQFPGLLAAKGCGALGADIILTLINRKSIDDFILFSEKNGLDIITIGCHADEGISFQNDSHQCENEVIVVNGKDNQISIADKMLVHQKGILHRAYSIFIFRKKNNGIEVLLQQRGKHKYHCGGLWSNTCCSHPHPGENTLMSAHLRLREEMGIDALLHEIGDFRYKAIVDNSLIEHEIDHVFIGNYEGNSICPNLNEIDNYKWVNLNNLMKDINLNPDKYTPWLKQALELIIQKNALKEYLQYI